jgi:glycerophosphoryl diester phosphodiesterase
VRRLGHGDPFHRLAWLVRGWRRKEPRRSTSPRDIGVIGHRGAPRVAAENTIAAFRAALDAGADAIETDVCATSDGKFVLWHDADPTETIAIARQTGREGLLYAPDVPLLWSRLRRPISRVSWEVFREHYGYCRRRDGFIANLIGDENGPPEVPVTTLDELLAWAAGEPRLRDIYLDVKIRPNRLETAIRLMERIEGYLEEGGKPHRPAFHYLSQHVEILDALCRREGRRGSRVGLFGDFEKPGVIEFSNRLGLKNVSMGNGQRAWIGFREELAAVLDARDRGRFHSVVVWTFNEPDQLSELIAMGVDGILTDDPALLRSLAPVPVRRPGMEPPRASEAAAS